MTRRSLVLAAALSLLLAPIRPAGAEVMSDSTVSDSWRLANGLEVRVRHIPGTQGIVITTGYRSGLLNDAAGGEGLAELLTHLQFYSAAGDTPDRTPEEMDSLRPLGWKAFTTARTTVLTEVASLPQFPGVLRQVATRMRGVTVTQAGLSAAVDSVRRERGARMFGEPAQGLYWRVRALAGGVSDESFVAQASGRGIAGLKLKDAVELLQSRFVPANACLALVGDFSNMNLRSLIEREFGSIPAGNARPEIPPVVLRGGERTSARPGLDRSLGAVGILAPALDDSLHPAFFLAGLVMGLHLRRTNGPPAPPLNARFQFSACDEPELLLLYPEVAADEGRPAALGEAIDVLTDGLGSEMLTRNVVDSVKRAWSWLLGGPLPRGVRQQASQAPGMLTPLTSSMVARALWRGDEFWSRYRFTFEETPLMPAMFFGWVRNPAHQARLIMTPKK